MNWVKKNWIAMVCGVVALAGIGFGVWAILGFADVQAEARKIAGIASTLDGLSKTGANLKAIEDARKYYEIANRETKLASDQAVAKNKRDPLRDDIFPAVKSPDAPYYFRDAYREAMRRLPQDLKAEKAPTGDVVDRIISRMEEKARREANVNVVGDFLHVPKAPDLPKVDPSRTATAALASTGIGAAGRGEDPRMMNRGEDPRMMNRGEDPRMMNRGEDPRMMNRGEDPRMANRGMSMPGARPGLLLPGASASSAQSAVVLPTRESLAPEAQRVATYETARRIWTYIDDASLQLHAIGDPSFQDRPDEIDMWSAQVFYWIEKDIIDALRRTNEQAAASLPEDQQWVAYLPVKHLVSLGISDYVAAGAMDETGRSSSITVLHRVSQGGFGGRVSGLGGGPGARASFTSRSGNDQYDIVQVSLNLVVDARDLPKVLVELCKQNFITPLNVEYRNVDVVGAREAGYLYGSAPVVNVDILCEILFFRQIYDEMKPDLVKKAMAGELMDSMGGRGGGRGMRY